MLGLGQDPSLIISSLFLTKSNISDCRTNFQWQNFLSQTPSCLKNQSLSKKALKKDFSLFLQYFIEKTFKPVEGFYICDWTKMSILSPFQVFNSFVRLAMEWGIVSIVVGFATINDSSIYLQKRVEIVKNLFPCFQIKDYSNYVSECDLHCIFVCIIITFGNYYRFHLK